MVGCDSGCLVNVKMMLIKMDQTILDFQSSCEVITCGVDFQITCEVDFQITFEVEFSVTCEAPSP